MVKAKKLEVMQKRISIAMVFIMAVFMLFMMPFRAHAAGGLELSTYYPGMSVKPGDNLSIPITLNNYSVAGMDADVSVSAIPEGWEGYLQGGSYQISKVHVKDGAEGAQITLHLTVPKIAGIDVDSSASKGSTVSVVPPADIAAGEYNISCSAVSAEETLTTDLKVVITGTYGQC